MKPIAHAREYAQVNIRIDDSSRCPFFLPNESQELSLTLRTGDTFVLDGATGVGKSSLAKSVLHSLQSRRSTKSSLGFTVSVNMDPMKPVRARMLFQNANLLDELSIMDNLQLGAASTCMSEGPGAQNWLELLGLSKGVEKLMPTQLSVGMRRRAALAQALVGAPDVLILDEPYVFYALCRRKGSNHPILYH